ncbi:MAG: hypothetical protein OEM60_14780, partial [Gammaproteobacteria bacterium]|nr:hypothetical protein [Gammaproteobacteria bacterium]
RLTFIRLLGNALGKRKKGTGTFFSMTVETHRNTSGKRSQSPFPLSPGLMAGDIIEFLLIFSRLTFVVLLGNALGKLLQRQGARARFSPRTQLDFQLHEGLRHGLSLCRDGLVQFLHESLAAANIIDARALLRIIAHACVLAMIGLKLRQALFLDL